MTSVLHLLENNDYSSCGYCNRAFSKSEGIQVVRLSIHDYEILMNRGFRRSGAYIYKPDIIRSCCKAYTIRLDASHFQIGKDQKKSLAKFNRFIIGDDSEKKLHNYKVQKDIEAIKSSSKDWKELKEQKRLLKNKNKPYVLEEHLLPTANLPDHITPAHTFEYSITDSSFTREKYALYKEYQKSTHADDDTSEKGFIRFLCAGDLFSDVEKDDPIGAKHVMYRIDGELVAMGVLDILPKSVSSVYFLYKEKMKEYDFGKIGALYEIAEARKRHVNYFLGLYYHDCPKMTYKATYKPSSLLDPISFDYYPFEEYEKGLKEWRIYLMSHQIGFQSVKEFAGIKHDPEEIEKYLKSVQEPHVFQKSFTLQTGPRALGQILVYLNGYIGFFENLDLNTQKAHRKTLKQFRYTCGEILASRVLLYLLDK